MIVQERIGTHIRTYSDKGVYIRGGFPEGNYAEAIDPDENGDIYISTIDFNTWEPGVYGWDIA